MHVRACVYKSIKHKITPLQVCAFDRDMFAAAICAGMSISKNADLLSAHHDYKERYARVIVAMKISGHQQFLNSSNQPTRTNNNGQSHREHMWMFVVNTTWIRPAAV